MKNHLSLTFIGLTALILSGCDTATTKLVNEKNSISMASLPLIQNTISAISPTFGGNRNDVIMEQVCALAEGSKTAQQFNDFFVSKGIDVNKLALQDSGFTLLADPDISKKKAACVAYIASSAFIQPLASDFIDTKVVDSPSPGKSGVNIDNAKLAKEFSRKQQIMMTNAEFFALISERIEKSPAQDISQHKSDIIKLANELSPIYMKMLEKNATNNIHYTVLNIQDGHFSFISSNGYTLSIDKNTATLRLLNINWYGEGELLGKRHFIQVISTH